MDKIIHHVLDAVPYAVLASMFIAARAIMYENYRSMKRMAVALFVALPLGVIAGGVMVENGFGTYTALAATGLVCLLGEHLFIYIVENPSKALKIIFDRFK